MKLEIKDCIHTSTLRLVQTSTWDFSKILRNSCSRINGNSDLKATFSSKPCEASKVHEGKIHK